MPRRRGAVTAAPFGGRRFERALERVACRLSGLPRHAGTAASVLLVALSAAYGAAASGKAGRVADLLVDMREGAAAAAGFPIASVSIDGAQHLSREEILAAAGVSGRASLLFLDVADARARLLTNPWIADATVQKLLPDRLVISLTERAAFALWQKEGRVGVIARDGTVLEPSVPAPYLDLPLVVGAGAEVQAGALVAMLASRPQLRAAVSAAVLVAQRRWNLRLRNGVDVRLPETGVERALDTFAELEEGARLSGRDITVIDLRLSDRVTVRLSDEALKAREDGPRKKPAKGKGGSA